MLARVSRGVLRDRLFPDDAHDDERATPQRAARAERKLLSRQERTPAGQVRVTRHQAWRQFIRRRCLRCGVSMSPNETRRHVTLIRPSATFSRREKVSPCDPRIQRPLARISSPESPPHPPISLSSAAAFLASLRLGAHSEKITAGQKSPGNWAGTFGILTPEIAFDLCCLVQYVEAFVCGGRCSERRCRVRKGATGRNTRSRGNAHARH